MGNSGKVVKGETDKKNGKRNKKLNRWLRKEVELNTIRPHGFLGYKRAAPGAVLTRD